jgi:DNA adenine methylase
MTQAQVATLLRKELDINSIYAQRLAAVVSKKNPVEEAKKIMAGKASPFVKWVGGKRQLLRQFRDLGLYPPEGFDPNTHTYFEPFVGGGAVFFDLLPRHAVLSDMNKELVVTYNAIKHDVEVLIAALKKHKYDKVHFLKVRAQDTAKLSNVEIAARFIYLNRSCFNGMYRVNSKGQFNVPFGRYSNPRICDADNLRKVAVALRHVTILHEDYSHVLTHAKKGDFVYFDPPYHPLSATASFTSYTANGFTAEDQIKLHNTFVKLHKRGYYMMLSNSSAPFINKIYSEIKDKKVRIIEINASRNINSQGNGRGKVKELLIINY